MVNRYINCRSFVVSFNFLLHKPLSEGKGLVRSSYQTEVFLSDSVILSEQQGLREHVFVDYSAITPWLVNQVPRPFYDYRPSCVNKRRDFWIRFRVRTNYTSDPFSLYSVIPKGTEKGPEFPTPPLVPYLSFTSLKPVEGFLPVFSIWRYFVFTLTEESHPPYKRLNKSRPRTLPYIIKSLLVELVTYSLSNRTG